MILIIDNYDSFTYNLYQYIGGLNPDIQVVRNDAMTVEEIRGLHPSHIVLSPGPGYPKDAGVCLPLLRAELPVPTMGVCLGHQAIGEAFGGEVVRAPRIMHGKADTATLDTACPLFAGLPEQIEVSRYHSLVVSPESLPDCLQVTATTDDGCVMGLRHRQLPVYGIQFHPESVLTPDGLQIIKNFLAL